MFILTCVRGYSLALVPCFTSIYIIPLQSKLIASVSSTYRPNDGTVLNVHFHV